MLTIAFTLLSGGLGGASLNTLFVAVAMSSTDHRTQFSSRESLCSVGGTVPVFGTGGNSMGPILFGNARTAEFGGHPIPERHEGKTFPVSLAGKYLTVAVQSGLALWERRRVDFTVQEVRHSGSLRTLYEWSGMMRITTLYLGGVEIEGTAASYDMSDERCRGRFNSIMGFEN